MPPEAIFGFLLAGLMFTLKPDGPGGRNGGQGNKPMGMDKRDQVELMKRMRGDD